MKVVKKATRLTRGWGGQLLENQYAGLKIPQK